MEASSGVVVLAACGVAVLGPTVVEAKRPPPATSCSAAVYTTRPSDPPKPVRAVRIGPAVFNSLAGLTTRRSLDRPSTKLPFYTVKSPLTILAEARRGVIITLLGSRANAALLYNRVWLRRLANWHYRFRDVPRSVRLALCRDAQTEAPLNTQYAGGFLLRKPGCVTIRVQAVGDTTAHRAAVPVGVRHC